MTASEPLSDIHDSTLYIFIDESGNFDFSERGTRHFVMAGVVVKFPEHSGVKLQVLKYKLLRSGFNVSGFHASQDLQRVRNLVFDQIAMLKSVEAFVVFGLKHKVKKSKRTDEELHATFAVRLIELILAEHDMIGVQNLVVVLDQALPKPKQGALHRNLKPVLKKLNKPLHLYFQPINRDMNGQIADYVAWSKFVALERDEHRPWSSLQKSLKPRDFDIFGS